MLFFTFGTSNLNLGMDSSDECSVGFLGFSIFSLVLKPSVSKKTIINKLINTVFTLRYF